MYLSRIFNCKVFIFYIITIFFLVILPFNSAGELNNITIINFRGDYFFHSILFLPWMFFGKVLEKSLLNWFVLGLFYASFSEFIQFFLSYRSFNINDLIANLIGVFFSFFILKIFIFFTINKN